MAEFAARNIESRQHGMTLLYEIVMITNHPFQYIQEKGKL
jgi:hypothetical protein